MMTRRTHSFRFSLRKTPEFHIKTVAAVVALLSALFVADTATAQSTFPDRPVHILVGYVPGNPNDIIARTIGDKLALMWNKPVIVDNLPGASANIAGDRVAKSPPDGYTLIMANMAQVVVNPALFEKMSYDPVKELAPIILCVFTPNILTVPNELPVHSAGELVEYMRKTPGLYTFGTAGIGTSQHLAGELFKSITKIDLQHIPYRGGPAVLTDLLGGRITMSFANVAPVLPLIREGRLRGLAVTSAKRFAAAADLPTMIEAGFPGFDVTASFGLMTATGTPADVIDKIYRDTAQVLAQDDVHGKLADIGMVVMGNSPAEFANAIKVESVQWGNLIRSIGIRANE